jgi:uncharacterized phage protein gp47/JayE
MEFKSLSDLIRYAENAFAVKFYSGAAVLRKGVLKIIASILGGMTYMISLLCKRIWKNRFLTTCDVEWLDGFGVEFELPHKAPTYAKGYVNVSFLSGSSMDVVPAGTYLIDPLTGLEYFTLVAQTVTPVDPRIRIVATEPGAYHNLSAGAILEWRDSAPTGLADSVEVAADGIFGGFSTVVAIDGVDQVWGETAEEYRQRLLKRERNQPQGGSVTDYELWAERFDFVTKAYVVPQEPNVNSVTVALADYHYNEIVVHPDDVQKVENYILAKSRRVATADPRVFSVTVANFDVKASIVPFNEEVQNSVSLAVKAFFAEKYPGTVSYFDDLIFYVRSNSLATQFSIASVKKGNIQVDSFALDLDADNSVAEVAKVSLTFSNGE